ncbi:D-alanyl-D-alanine carboxypeptidase/D-alanyl-D-alanine-endopeptidase [Desulfurivibrio alkaliphilus]|uniref:D-alanyl-D-alanine carboxypeptidase/D-alanyl-D-alanine-endopeptidase n=1 Tax=Desulfurivibrio alkaliphilus (strain DSM 19089 / UNIQEM U267 / AHT2) TaxID=589865 RepID=D6Z0L0_DESAT|nr:D-alanyl-D-alanine carboxypeptidase [Desulfurivibrio alkaliphilus]ADH85239.1 D-alanyl-D-alanine carboxypeptidase/D-alanyl-D-alanine-endopeptidase [Desulfurivibrio alkaliphilus AHT 2]
MPPILATLCWLLLWLLPGPAAAGLPPSVFSDGGYLLSKDGRLLLAHNHEQALVPASTWKIATGLMALEQLGPDFRFATELYRTNGALYIKGFGDPMLISEEVAAISAALAAAGISEINDIVLDDSFFQLEQANPAGSAASLRSYDAANGALVVNFNTAKIEVRADGTVHSAEPQTPTLPIMQQWAGKLPPGVHRINLSHTPAASLRYSGELFKYLFAARDIRVTGKLRHGRLPAGAELIYRHHSARTLAETVEAMLLYSNNFIANQLFLVAAAKGGDNPATWGKARVNLHDYLLELGLPPGSFRVDEGSGLSRDNRISPDALHLLLQHFRPYAELLPHWEGRLVKSGTLNGVYAYAGYFRGPEQLDPFVLILQQTANTRDRALEIMEGHWQNATGSAAPYPDHNQ